MMYPEHNKKCNTQVVKNIVERGKHSDVEDIKKLMKKKKLTSKNMIL